MSKEKNVKPAEQEARAAELSEQDLDSVAGGGGSAVTGGSTPPSKGGTPVGRSTSGGSVPKKKVGH